MSKSNELTPNTFFIEVSGAGIPEVDGLFVPSTAPRQNRNREPFQAQAIGTARWRGIEQTENPLAARHCRTQTPTSPGPSVGWMGIWRTT